MFIILQLFFAIRAVFKIGEYSLISGAGEGGGGGWAGSPSHNASRMNYISNRRLSRDLLVVSGYQGVKSHSLLKVCRENNAL